LKYQGRDYQLRVDDEIMTEFSGNRNPVVNMVTRSGKSWNICKIAERGYKHNRPVMILVHTDILLDQISADLIDHGIPHGILKSGHFESRDIVQVVSRNTLVARLKKNPESYSRDHFAAICIDEGHLSKSNGYMMIIQHFNTAKLVLFSGTPVRLDGSGFDDICHSMIHGPSKQELISRGIILPSIVATPEVTMLSGLKSSGGDYTRKSQEKALTGRYLHAEYIDSYFKYTPNEPGLIFVPTIDFGKEVAENFTANGIPTVEISARDGKKVRDQKLHDYYTGKYKLLSSVDLFIMGLTIRRGSTAIVMRPTQSTMVYFQMLARCTLPGEGKTHQTVLDLANNIYTHGHPDLVPDFKLGGETKEERISRQADIANRIVRCSSCKWPYDLNAVMPRDNGDIACPRCGALREVAGQTMKIIDGKLQLVSSAEWEKYEMNRKWEIEQAWLAEQAIENEKAVKRLEVRNASTREELLAIAKARGYSQKWVEYRLAGKAQARQKYNNKGYNNNSTGSSGAVKPAQSNSVPIF
jgi:superfamily II DNA or RNA helicase